VGISSVSALAALDDAQAQAVCDQLRQHGAGARSPGPKTLKKWIDSAKDLNA
jgi:hypothetical protein